MWAGPEQPFGVSGCISLAERAGPAGESPGSMTVRKLHELAEVSHALTTHRGVCDGEACANCI